MVLIKQIVLGTTIIAALLLGGQKSACAQDFKLAAEAKQMFAKGLYVAADSLYTLALRERTLTDPRYIEVLCDRIDLLVEMNKIESVSSQLDAAFEAYGKANKRPTMEYARLLGMKGSYLVKVPDYEGAMQTFEEAEKVFKAIGDTLTHHYGEMMLNRGTTYTIAQEFEKAQYYYNISLDVARKIDHQMLRLESIINLASISIYTGQIEKYIEPFAQCVMELKEVLGDRHPDYIITLSNYGVMCIYVGDLLQAEKILTHALKLAKDELGDEHHQYMATLSMLAYIYTEQSRQEEAEQMHIESLRLRRKVSGNKHPSVANGLNHLAIVQNSLGKYRQAIESLEEAIEIMKLYPDQMSTQRATIYNTLGTIYNSLKEFDQAILVFGEALEEQKTNNMVDDPLSIAIITNLCASLYQGQYNKYDEVESLLESVVKSCAQSNNASSPALLNALNNLAVLYASKHKYEQAFKIFDQIITAEQKVSGGKNWSHISTLWVYGLYLALSGDYVKSYQYNKECLDIMTELTARDFMFLSEADRQQYWARNHTSINDIQRSAARCTNDSVRALSNALVYDCELLDKNLLLSSSTTKLRQINQSGDQSLKDLWRKMIDLRAKEDTEASQKVEAELISRLKSKGIADEFSIRSSDVCQMLSQGEAAIEIVNFQSLPGDSLQGRFYYALILRKNSTYPDLVYIGEENLCRQVIESDGNELYDLLIKPMERYLNGVKTLYVSPSGLFNTVSFASLQDEKGSFLTDRYTTHNLLSTRDVARVKARQTIFAKNSDIALFGGADFGLQPSDLPDIETQTAGYRGTVSDLRQSRGQGFDYLPGSKQEVEAIDSILSDSQWKTALFVDGKASEAQFKAYSGLSPRVIHLSTHGFYLTKELSEVDSNAENLNSFARSTEPLVRSGLAFAGANSVWADGTAKAHAGSANDGILTASEIANLDFTKTDLVVLSACDSGLGDIDYSEGVYGMARGFRLAGAGALVVTLWKIPDTETAKFMTLFYTHLSKGVTVKEAFDKSQRQFRNEYPSKSEHWAAFTLIE